ncbi:lasso RiPP family leader peptide-containing protein [Micromonospora wenchangensis]
MNEMLLEYEPPAMSEVGDFAELTMGMHYGRWLDGSFVFSWFDF